MGNIDKLVIFRFIEMMVMIGIGIKQAIVIMNHHPTKQASLGKLVQCIVNRSARHMQAGSGDFFSQAISCYMAMAAVKKQRGNRHPLARWPQTGKAQFFSKMRLWRPSVLLGHIFVTHLSHCWVKMSGHRPNVNNALAWRGISCFL